jgi:hypothetical protein
MGRDVVPAAGVDLPRVTTAVWEQMAAAKRLLERLGAIRAAPREAVPAAGPLPPAAPRAPDAITVAAGWGRDSAPSGAREA